jgi:ketol-acid reductoisomerase
MTKLFYDADADVHRLDGRRVAIVGYGSQGHAHALNLRDSGVDVVVGLREDSRSRTAVKAAGLSVASVDDAAEDSQIIMILTPDTGQGRLYCDHVQKHLAPGKTLMFAHGFNIRFGQITPPAGVDVSMVAPKAPGHRVREVFEQGGAPGCVGPRAR